MTARTVAVVLPAEDLLTSNMRVHHMVRAKRTDVIRTAFRRESVRLLPLETPVEVRAELAFQRAHRRDATNWAPTFKACVDGLVDAGLITDDSDKHITQTVIPAHTVDRALPPRHVRLTITLTEAHP